MSSRLISLAKVGMATATKKLFSDFSTTVHPGARIALIGDNGSGKTTLLNLLAEQKQPTDGTIAYTSPMRIGILTQTMQRYQERTVWHAVTELIHKEQYRAEQLLTRLELIDKKDNLVATLSGGQQTMVGMIRLMLSEPDVMLLDEPTNNLDARYRQQLYRFLQEYSGATIIVSHNPVLLRQWPDTFWHINNQAVSIFNGNFDEFMNMQQRQQEQAMATKQRLEKEKKHLNKKLNLERKRTAQRSKQGVKKHGNDRAARGAAKERGEQTMGRNTVKLYEYQQEVTQSLIALKVTEKISPSFNITPTQLNRAGIYVRDGSVGYNKHPVLHDVSIAIEPGDRVCIKGLNGSGKSTLLRALRQQEEVLTTGSWQLPNKECLGYLDQHYSMVMECDNALAAIKKMQPSWTDHEIRTHLNQFLFRKNEEVMLAPNLLSGGEKARLSLAMIAAQSPAVLLLDEITNNIDLTTRAHCVTVLTQYPGTLIVVSHDEQFLAEISCSNQYHVGQGTCKRKESH